MKVDLRKSTRFEDFGRIDCAELCPMNGVLDDISMDGCKVHFDAPVTLLFENDYELHVRFSRNPTEVLVLMAHPEWSREDDETTYIGFSILRSPDSARLEEYVHLLHAESQDLDTANIVTEDDTCLFV